MEKFEYGELPPAPDHLVCQIRGDALLYPLLGLDWLNQRVLVGRAGGEWIAAADVQLDVTLEYQDTAQAAVAALL